MNELLVKFNPYPNLIKREELDCVKGFNTETRIGCSIPFQYKEIFFAGSIIPYRKPAVYKVRDYENESKILAEKLLYGELEE